jgi:Zn-finger protein
MTDMSCPTCGRNMLFLSVWWCCETCGWAHGDEVEEKIRQELANGDGRDED